VNVEGKDIFSIRVGTRGSGISDYDRPNGWPPSPPGEVFMGEPKPTLTAPFNWVNLDGSVLGGGMEMEGIGMRY